MPKSIAYVSSNSTSMTGRVTVFTPEEKGAARHRDAALVAAFEAVGRWGAIEGQSVIVDCPAYVRVGGRALREALAQVTAEARDAAKASLRASGYIVRKG